MKSIKQPQMKAPAPVPVVVPAAPPARFRDLSTTRQGLVVSSKIVNFLWRRRVELAPAEVSVALVGIAWGAQNYVPDAPWWTAGTAAAVVAGQWFYAPYKWDRDAEVIYARWATLAAAAWVVAVVAVGFNQFLWLALVVGALVGGGFWWFHKLPVFNKPSKLVRYWDSWWQEVAELPKVSLQGSRVVEVEGPEDEPGKIKQFLAYFRGILGFQAEEEDEEDKTDAGTGYVRLRIKLVAGEQLPEELKNAAAYIAGFLRMDPSAVTSRPVRGDGLMVDLIIRETMAINDTVAWDSKLAARSAKDPFFLGRSESGEVFKRLLHKTHWMLVGQTRWGKSMMVQAMLANISLCDGDVFPIMIDLKGGNTARPWRNLLGWIATDYEEAVLMLTIVNRWIQIRAKNAGTSDFMPTKRRPAIVIFFDEMGPGIGALAPDKRLYKQAVIIGQQGLGLGFVMVDGAQDGSLDSWEAEQFRGNFDSSLLFHVREPALGSYVIKDTHRYNGAAIEEKGQFYFKGDGKVYPGLLRGPDMNPKGDDSLAKKLVADAVKSGRLAVLEDELIEAAGWAWDQRWDRYEGRATINDAQLPDHSPDPDKIVVEEAGAPGSAAWEDARRAEAESVPSGVLDDEAMRMAQELMGAGGFAKHMKEAEINLCKIMAGISPEGIQVKELFGNGSPYKVAGRTVVHQLLGVLLEAGKVCKPRTGWYAPMPGVGAQEMMQALVQARTDTET